MSSSPSREGGAEPRGFPGRKCPQCGGELEHGYGLMGGGIGPYEFCQDDGCDYFYKEQDRDEE